MQLVDKVAVQQLLNPVGAANQDFPRSPSARVILDGKFFRRDGQRFPIQGVTYGPFAPPDGVEPFPGPDQVRTDFALMHAIGINSIRTYHLPPEWLLQQATESGIAIFLDVPWPKHLCFLDTGRFQDEARAQVRRAVERGRDFPCVLAYSVGNEIPADIVRWHGSRRVERFIRELQDLAKQTDSSCLTTYANFPPTEFLDLSFLDFVTFNVYLHDLETFRRYLLRLQNLVGDKPLLLGELGMDTLRNGELKQAQFLNGHVREAALLGLAGTFIFAWTDDWYTGDCQIKDWAFGITNAERFPKASYSALAEVLSCPPYQLLSEKPKVSVVVCSYNGGQTLDQCLRSLLALDYPNYEVIVVDDGSTDDTRSILARYPSVRAIHQPNLGLSMARNVGLRAASGAIIAFTDSDCFADANWLTHLVYQFQHTEAAAVGGPNLSPDDGKTAACVAACPGQPMHVLESDQVAEHIPGCNMAFRREVLEAINGFDPQYRKAGDDVDVCWRLQQAGYWITIAPGAFVWHHRRQTPRAYLRQQAGYGEAEALLRFKHPDKFNGRGDSKWNGVLYGPSLRGLHLDEAIIYRGTFATGFFQCLYQPRPAHWAMFPASLEWHFMAGLAALAALHWPLAWIGVAAMLVLSWTVAGIQAAQARLAPEHAGFRSRGLIMALCYLQPLVRSWSRYRTRFFSYRAPTPISAFPANKSLRLSLGGKRKLAYWTEEGYSRTEVLGLAIAYFNEHGWGKTVDSGWQDWDLEIYCHPWTVVQICTAQEELGGNERLIRVRYRLRLSGYSKGVGFLGILCCAMAAMFSAWPVAVVGGVFLAGVATAWWRGTSRASRAVSVVDGLARKLGLIPCDTSPGASTEGQQRSTEK